MLCVIKQSVKSSDRKIRSVLHLFTPFIGPLAIYVGKQDKQRQMSGNVRVAFDLILAYPTKYSFSFI